MESTDYRKIQPRSYMHYWSLQSRCSFGLNPECPLVNMARGACPPSAVVLRASPRLGFRSAFLPSKCTVGFGPLVLGWSLGFISCLQSVFVLVFPVSPLFFNGICHWRHTVRLDSWVWSWHDEEFFLPVQVNSMLCISTNMLGGAI